MTNDDPCEINYPPLWDAGYHDELKREIFQYMDRCFHGSNDKRKLMAAIMRETRGTVNPKMVEEFVDEYIRVSED